MAVSDGESVATGPSLAGRDPITTADAARSAATNAPRMT